MHRLVGIHGVQAGRVETGQPHVAHDDELEGVIGVFEAIYKLAAGVLAADVLLLHGSTVRAAVHDDFHDAGFPFLGFGLRTFGNKRLGLLFYDSPSIWVEWH